MKRQVYLVADEQIDFRFGYKRPEERQLTFLNQDPRHHALDCELHGTFGVPRPNIEDVLVLENIQGEIAVGKVNVGNGIENPPGSLPSQNAQARIPGRLTDIIQKYMNANSMAARIIVTDTNNFDYTNQELRKTLPKNTELLTYD